MDFSSDFRHLDETDLEYECISRGVNQKSPTVLDKLDSHLMGLDSQLHFDAVWRGRGLNGEITLIAEKLDKITQNVEEAIAQGDLSLLEIYVTRI